MWLIKKIISKGRYNYALVPEHPNATKNGYVLEHRIVMENYLGRLLTKKEVVHHINNKPKDNRIENLKAMSASNHAKVHGNKGRLYLKLRCPACNKIFNRGKNNCFHTKSKIFVSCSNSCRGRFSRQIQLFGFTDRIKKALRKNVICEFKKYGGLTQLEE